MLCALAIASPAAAQQKTLTIGGYGGSFETLMKELLIPEFEKTHDVKIAFVSGNSTENLARLQAQKGAQELDVVLLDDGPMYQTDALGFCAPLVDSPVKADVYDLARMGENAIGIGFVATGFTYNKDWFEREGWEPPKSWAELQDPKYDQILSIPSISNTYGLHALVMLARGAGGGETDIEPGFTAMKDEVGPNVLVYEPSAGKMSELFQSEEIAISVWGSGRTKSLADTGFAAGFAYPEDGAVALLLAACPVVDSDVPEEAQQFIDFLLDPEVQVKFADAMGAGPVNTKSELPPELAESLPYGDKIKSLVTVDWNTINQNRDAWTQRWAREVER
ncbi:branched-chain amino acid ABC transporter substrate-binding protein [Paracoccus yeei]|nr:branched-chain amino acid ABC transporter substrate-binding protein [Paracoccus yeei]